MGRYFFDIHDGVELRDDVGREIDGGATLRAEALKVAHQLMAAEAEDARETTLVLTVRDGENAIALKVRLVCQI